MTNHEAYSLLLHLITKIAFKSSVELAWRSDCVTDCHATTRGSIPSGDGVTTELHVLRKGQ